MRRANKEWGGSGIEKSVFSYIRNILAEGSTILELGSGHVSTKSLSGFYKLYSVEENIKYVGLYNSKYIYAPIKRGWYDVEVLRKQLPSDYDLLLVDGPSGTGNRDGMLYNLNLFKRDIIYVFHDTNRKSEKVLAEKVAKKLNKQIEFFDDGDFWGVIL